MQEFVIVRVSLIVNKSITLPAAFLLSSFTFDSETLIIVYFIVIHEA